MSLLAKAVCPRLWFFRTGIQRSLLSHLLGAHAWWVNGFLSGIRVLRCDYSRVTRVSSTSYDSSNEPAVIAHFWLRRGRMVLRPHLFCLTSRFTHLRSLYWVLGLCGVRQGYGCIGNGRCDDYSADSSASLAQCCSYGGFFPSFAIFALVWGLLFFLGILAFIPRLHFWCCLFCSACLFCLLVASLFPFLFPCGRISLEEACSSQVNGSLLVPYSDVLIC